MPDESHTSIRRSFTPQHEPSCKRHFCGYCGTHLSYWSEQPSTERDYLRVTVGSLVRDDLDRLQELGLLPEEDAGSNHSAVAQSGNGQPFVRSQRQLGTGNISWFEEMIDGSSLGRVQRTNHGTRVSADGTTRIEWEVSEYVEGDNPGTPGRGKRKQEEA